jgi:hypothetical protein
MLGGSGGQSSAHQPHWKTTSMFFLYIHASLYLDNYVCGLCVDCRGEINGGESSMKEPRGCVDVQNYLWSRYL